MDRMRLPNGQTVYQINPGETGLMYRNIVACRSYLQHGVALRPGTTVFDVGANIGISALFFHWECPDLRIFAFEPAPLLFEALTANLAEHQVKAIACNYALHRAPGTRQLTYYPDTTAMSGLYADPDNDAELTRVFLANSGFDNDDVEDLAAGRHSTVTSDCRLRTISEVVEECHVDAIDLLKINVERAEGDVLAGVAESFWPRIRQLTMQLHDIEGRLKEVSGELAGRGYRVAVAQDPLLAGTEIYELFAVRT